MKGFKTTIVSTIFAAIIIGLILSMVLDLVTFEEFKETVSVITPVAIIIIGWFAKDANQSHTKS